MWLLLKLFWNFCLNVKICCPRSLFWFCTAAATELSYTMRLFKNSACNNSLNCWCFFTITIICSRKSLPKRFLFQHGFFLRGDAHWPGDLIFFWEERVALVLTTRSTVCFTNLNRYSIVPNFHPLYFLAPMHAVTFLDIQVFLLGLFIDCVLIR